MTEIHGHFETIAAVAAAALTATLVGCGGGDIRDERDEARMKRDEAEVELARTQSDLDRVLMDLGQARSDLEQVQAEADAARAGAATAEQARMEATQAAAAAEQARMEATQAAAAARQARMEAQTARIRAEAERDAAIDALHAAEQARAASASAKVLLGVLMDAAVNLDEDDAAVHVPPAPTLSVSNEGMLEARVSNVGGYTMAAMAPDMIEGWRGATLTNRRGDTAVVYSDIGRFGTVTLVDRYDSNLPTATAPRTWNVGTVNSGDLEYIQWASVKRPDEDSSLGGAPGEVVLTFKGAVHNIPGTFSCDVGTAFDTCRAPDRYSDDSVEGDTTDDGGADGSWTFVPDDTGRSIYHGGYLVFGWWLSKDPNGMLDDLTLISSATDVGNVRTATSTAGSALRGSATYTGAAAGQYVMAREDSDNYDGGHFTAMATLEADFDADSTFATPAANDRSGIALSGMIDHFMTGDVSRPDWVVKLMADSDSTTDGMQPVANLGAAIVGDTADADPDAAGVQPVLTTEWSTGGAQKGTGTWTATFYGGDDDQATSTTLPVAATGTFNAHLGTADAAVRRLQGAFGVNKMDE